MPTPAERRRRSPTPQPDTRTFEFENLPDVPVSDDTPAGGLPAGAGQAKRAPRRTDATEREQARLQERRRAAQQEQKRRLAEQERRAVAEQQLRKMQERQQLCQEEERRAREALERAREAFERAQRAEESRQREDERKRRVEAKRRKALEEQQERREARKRASEEVQLAQVPYVPSSADVTVGSPTPTPASTRHLPVISDLATDVMHAKPDKDVPRERQPSPPADTRQSPVVADVSRYTAHAKPESDALHEVQPPCTQESSNSNWRSDEHSAYTTGFDFDELDNIETLCQPEFQGVSLDGEWQCRCDYFKSGSLVDLHMIIAGSSGQYYMDGGTVRNTLFDICSRKEDGSVFVDFCWANCNGWSGSGTWALRGNGECLVGTWRIDGSAGGPWEWSGIRTQTAADPVQLAIRTAPGTQDSLFNRPFPCLDGEWECVCDFNKSGKIVNLLMDIEGSAGKCYVDDNVAFRLSDIRNYREGRWLMVTCAWACRWGEALEEGSATWRLRGAGDFVEGVIHAVPCNCLEGSWAQSSHTDGPWRWNCRRTGTLWWFERPPPAEGEAASRGGQGAGLLVPQWQRERQALVEGLLQDEAELERAPEVHRGDPDIVLAAVSRRAEALSHASAELLLDRDFLLEVVQRSAAALAFIPRALRQDPALLLAAARGNAGALLAAPRNVREVLADLGTEEEAGRAARLQAYDGEALRLVGPCNAWRTTDAHLRFEKIAAQVDLSAADPTSASLGGAPPCTACFKEMCDLVKSSPQSTVAPCPDRAGTRHQLVVCMLSNRLSFQIVSCVKGNSFKIFPIKADDDGLALLTRGDPRAVMAGVGGEKHGRDKTFCIEEDSGTTVRVFVELSSDFAAVLGTTLSLEGRGAAGTLRGVAVWYAVSPAGPSKLHDLRVALRGARLMEPPRSERPRGSMEAAEWQKSEYCSQIPGMTRQARTSPWEAIIIADADNPTDQQALCSSLLLLNDASRFRFKEGVQELMGQVPVLNSEDLSMEAEPLDLGYKRTTLLVDAAGATLLGYCQWVECNKEAEGFMWILHLAVLEAYRGEGLGRVLVRWAVARAAARNGRGLRLQSVDSAVSFYEACGFAVRTSLVARVRGVPMELRLPPRLSRM